MAHAFVVISMMIVIAIGTYRLAGEEPPGEGTNTGE